MKLILIISPILSLFMGIIVLMNANSASAIALQKDSNVKLNISLNENTCHDDQGNVYNCDPKNHDSSNLAPFHQQ